MHAFSRGLIPLLLFTESHAENLSVGFAMEDITGIILNVYTCYLEYVRGSMLSHKVN